MKFESIEFKNIFAYGEELHRIDYSNTGKLILLKGQSGAGKSAILSLPILVLYGKLTSVTKTSIANRVNKHGWVRGTIIKGQHKYTIEREFSPNSLKIWKDDVEVDTFGASAAEDYIQNEIIEIPINTFTNMIAISMKKFRSFLKMSPTERKQIVDEVFDVRVINMVFDQLKKDTKEIGNRINGDQSTMFSLNQTLTNATQELLKIQEKNASPEDKTKIEENNKKIDELNKQLLKYNDAMQTVAEKQRQNTEDISNKRREITENDMTLRTIADKMNLYSQSKCPTCSAPFVGEVYDQLKQKLTELQKTKTELKQKLTNELYELSEATKKIQTAQQKVNTGMYQIRVDINNLYADNRIIDEKMKASSEYQAVQNIIDNTTKQIDEIKEGIEEKTSQLIDLQKLQIVYSIEGVTKMVIENYLPKLNSEIAENLMMLGFPYNLEFDSSFKSVLKDMNQTIDSTTLSDGEETRIDLVVLLSLYKLLLRRHTTLNLLSIDEVVSSLDVENSAKVIEFLKVFAEENNLNIFIVSHTNLDLDNFDEIIEVEKNNGFSHFTKSNTAL